MYKLIDEVFGETIKDLRCRGLIKEEGEFISLTERGKVIGNEVFEAFLLNSEAAAGAAAEVEPVGDVQADAGYRREVLVTLVRRALSDAARRARPTH
ncbi:hypothetical protein ACWEH1_17525 [Micromonospora chersina]